MRTGYGFIEFENANEFKNWLAGQKVTRTVTIIIVGILLSKNRKIKV